MSADGAHAVWRPLQPDDLDAVDVIADTLHPAFFERRETVEEKLALFPSGCWALGVPGRSIVGYGLGYPWRPNEVPKLNTLHGAYASPGAWLYIHDVAILPEGRGRGAAGEYVRRMQALARRLGLTHLALSSVYGTAPFWRRHGFEPVDSPTIGEALRDYGPDACYMTAVAAA